MLDTTDVMVCVGSFGERTAGEISWKGSPPEILFTEESECLRGNLREQNPVAQPNKTLFFDFFFV